MLRACLVVLAACGSSSTAKPSGTTSDPVETCEKVADVCRLDGAKLGVCVQSKTKPGTFTCASQH
ncbi:MAG: hypothetical protein ABI867_35315 [Kofleriaceae bacterium]